MGPKAAGTPRTHDKNTLRATGRGLHEVCVLPRAPWPAAGTHTSRRQGWALSSTPATPAQAPLGGSALAQAKGILFREKRENVGMCGKKQPLNRDQDCRVRKRPQHVAAPSRQTEPCTWETCKNTTLGPQR